MGQEQNQKTLRHFQCRDYLWEIFEQMSGELECSTDYLINEAMRQYARARNYGTRQSPTPSGQARQTMPAPDGMGGPTPIPSLPVVGANSTGSGGQVSPVVRPAGPRPIIPSAPPPPPVRSVPGHSASGPGPASPAPNNPSLGPSPRVPAFPLAPAPPTEPSTFPSPATTRPPPLSSVAPPPLPHARSDAGSATPLPALYVVFNGQKVTVNKEEFVIGRGSKSADLAIRDGNVSRRHAAVVFQNGAFYMKDLGSTNGVEHQGSRIDSKRIEEGDIFQICDYELRFTYR